MSIKIYTAYRMPTKLFTSEFLPTFRQHVITTVAKYIEGSIKGRKKIEQLRQVFKRMAELSGRPTRNPDCIDCSLHVWLHGNFAYCVPLGERWIWENVKLPAGVEDYAYWDNSDKPDEVTARQWRARGEMWHKVCLDDWDDNRLRHTVIDASKKIGLSAVARKFVPSDEAEYAIYFRPDN